MTLIRMEALDLFCGLTAIFIVLILDSMVAVKHHDDIIRRLKMEHAELQGQELSLSKDLKKLNQGLKSSTDGLQKNYEELKNRGQTIMRLRKTITNCKDWDSTGLGVSSLRSGNGNMYKVLVEVDSSGNRASGWKYWCFSQGHEHPFSDKRVSAPSPIPSDLQKKIEEILKNSNEL